MMTSESLKAQGTSIKRAALTGSILRELLGVIWTGATGRA